MPTVELTDQELHDVMHVRRQQADADAAAAAKIAKERQHEIDMYGAPTADELLRAASNKTIRRRMQRQADAAAARRGAKQHYVVSADLDAAPALAAAADNAFDALWQPNPDWQATWLPWPAAFGESPWHGYANDVFAAAEVYELQRPPPRPYAVPPPPLRVAVTQPAMPAADAISALAAALTELAATWPHAAWSQDPRANANRRPFPDGIAAFALPDSWLMPGASSVLIFGKPFDMQSLEIRPPLAAAWRLPAADEARRQNPPPPVVYAGHI